MGGIPLKPQPSRLPWRRHRQELAAAKAGNATLWRIITDAHRELDKLDGSYDRGGLSLSHRIAIYRTEQRMQPKADETGQVWHWVCIYDGAQHQHEVRPSEVLS